MGLTLVIPDLRFARQPGFDPTLDLALPALAQLLGRAVCRQSSAMTSEHYWRTVFEGTATSAAVLTLAIDAPSADTGYWIRADPVHLRPDRDRAVLFDASLLHVQMTEAEQLVASLNALYAADGFMFIAPTPDRWYLRLPAAPDFTTTPLARAIGQNVQPLLPQGNSALSWHRMLNELQMLLYAHPVNDAREQAGYPTINSLWLWGEGALPGDLAKPCQQLYTDDTLAAGFANAAGVQFDPLPSRFSMSTTQADTLVYLDTLSASTRHGDVNQWRSELARLEVDWFAPLLAAWQAGELAEITLVLLGMGHNLTLRLEPAARWKFWRRPAKVGVFLAEAR